MDEILTKQEIEPLTKREQQISNLLYNELWYMYCDNCRFESEISKEESREKYGNWVCEDCYRKYNSWGISRATCDRLARNIGDIFLESWMSILKTDRPMNEKG